MAYTTDAAFENSKPHRDVSVWPTSAKFAVMITEASSDINNYLQVDSDVDDDDGIVLKIINQLLEGRLRWLEDQANPDVPYADEPELTDAQKQQLDRIMGTEDPPAHSYDIYKTYGGGYTLD